MPTRRPCSVRWRRTPSRTPTTSATLHSERLSAPRGWEVLRLAPDPKAQGPSSDDLLALADAVREAGRPAPAPAPLHSTDDPSRGAKRGHLRVLTSTD